MISFMNILNIYSINFYVAFGKAQSTAHVLFRLLQQCQSELDPEEFVGTSFMDLSQKYNCLPRNLIIAKLETYGLNYNSLKFMLDYLTSRKQITSIGTSYNNWTEIFPGITQGSISDPLLFNIFI